MRQTASITGTSTGSECERKRAGDQRKFNFHRLKFGDDLEFSLVDRFANCFDLFLGQLNLTGIRVGDCLVWIASAN
jgi:hypothetical protein